LLLCLADSGRWKAVVWIVKHVVDGLWKSSPHVSPATPAGPWSEVGNLDAFLNTSCLLEPPVQPESATQAIRLKHYVDTENAFEGSKQAELLARHAALGQIWQSLGNMILSDSAKGTSISPELLEVLAIMHSRGIMPESIYRYAPPEEPTTLDQPPTLHLLSSRILTSLSDAAWRAHETLIVEEAREKGGSYASLRPEIPGSVYRVRVGGLRHEIWLELVLWTCLHGGWLRSGAAVLESIMAISNPSDPNRWSALSWRELVTPSVQAGQEKSINWDEVRYMLDTGGYVDSTEETRQRQKVARTVSSEVVMAYIDGMISLMRVGVGDRGTSAGAIVDFAIKGKAFVSKNTHGLESTIWDAVTQRILEAQPMETAQFPALATKLVSLSSSSQGQGNEHVTRTSSTRNELWQPLSPYPTDSSAASVGLAHRILLVQIREGNVAAALRSFQALQNKVDRNIRNTLAEFFRNIRQSGVPEAVGSTDDAEFQFSSPYATIDYPSFSIRLPVPILAPFLDLVADAGAIKFGTWLLQSQDPDGPTIPQALYTNPHMIPALIRFATTSRNRDLLRAVLSKVTKSSAAADSTVSIYTIISVLESQLSFDDWHRAVSTLDTISDHPRLSPQYSQLVITIILQARLRLEKLEQQTSSQGSRELTGKLMVARNTVERIATGKYMFDRRSIDTVFAVLAATNLGWAHECAQLLQRGVPLLCNPSARSFNTILGAIVDAQGSEAGRNLVSTMWKPAKEEIQRSSSSHEDEPESDEEDSEDITGEIPRMPKKRPEASRSVPDDQVIIDLPLQSGRAGGAKNQQLRIVARVQPGSFAFRRILVKAYEEIEEALDQGPQQTDEARKARRQQARTDDSTVQWAMRMLRRLGVSEEDVLRELNEKELP